MNVFRLRNQTGIVLSLFILLVVSSGCDAWARVHGKVVDEQGKPIAEAKIVVNQGDSYVKDHLSDTDGSFDIFDNIAPGPIGSRMITIKISKDGYQPFELRYDWTKEEDKVANKFVVTLKRQQ